MHKRTSSAVDDSDDGSVELSIEVKKSRDFKGSDENLIDAETGETVFEDISPRFRAHVNEAVKRDSADEDDEDDEDFEGEDDSDEKDDEPEEEPEEDPEPEEEPEEDAPRRNKRSIRNRLARKQRQIDEERANYEDIRAELDQLKAAQNTRASDEEFNKTKTTLDAEIVRLEKELEDAIEEGQTKSQVNILSQLTDAKAKLLTATNEHERAKEAAKAAPSTVNTVAARKADQWKRKHPRFLTDPVFNAFVVAVDKTVAGQGYRIDSDEYYKELDKRIKAKYPEEYKNTRSSEDERRELPKRRKPPTVAHRNHQSAEREGNFEVRGGKVKLTKRQLENMRKFQLDPTNPADVRAYVRENQSR